MKQVSPDEAVGLKFPEWLIMVVSRDAKGQPNVQPAGWGMICSGDPLYVAVAISPENYTCQCIRETGEFVFAWPGEGQDELIMQTGTCHGNEVNKFEEFNIPWSEPVATNVPLLDGAAANLECQVMHEYQPGDCVMFIGEVVAAHVPDEPIGKLSNFAGKFAVARPL